MLGLVVVVGLLGAFWAGWVREHEESARLRETLHGNALMVERMKLPMSGQMVGNLSTAMGRPVGVISDAGVLTGGEGWGEREHYLAESAVSGEGTADDFGYEAVSVPVAGGGRLVVIRELGVFRDGRVWGFLWVVLPLGALAAFFLARRLSRPLEDLAEAAPDFGEAILPERLTGRGDEVGILARALDGARERILNEQALRERSERLAMLGQIATGLAHEIKNPASAILMQAELMEGAAGRLVRDEAEEIVGLVNQWLFIAQPSPPRVGMHDLVAELGGMVERRGEVFAYHGVTVELSAPEVFEVECDVRRVMQAVRNVVDNGVAAMPAGGALKILLESFGDEVCLTVRDGGCGFSEEALANFGEPFFSEKEGGMGLGLAMVKGVVEGHGGRLEVFNDGGGVVRMWFFVRKNLV